MYQPDLSKVTILVKTLLRDAHLFAAVNGILKTLPEARIIVADDGRRSEMKSGFYARLRAAGHTVLELPFDVGFGAKSNAAIWHLRTPYALIGSDDFDFADKGVRSGIEKMVAVLDGDPLVAIASGRVNGYPYEGWLEDEGQRVTERRISYHRPQSVNGATYHLCNLTVNYSLIRSSVLGFGEKQVHWNSQAKIGQGEHGRFYVDVKRAGYSVAYVEDANIKEIYGIPVSPEYAQLRSRAKLPTRICFDEIGIREYVCFDGTVDYNK